MLKINGRTFMNLQEAVQWLLDNNALPFQSSANYIANTEIGMGTIVNPSPAKVRIGSLIFFADSKVSTVIGLTENGFIVSDQYNNLVDDIAYVTNVSINASGHLITTLSDGQTIDAGIVKQVSGFSINASQHLIVTYNDGTTTDLGAIFSGNITVSGNLTVTGGISGNAITGDSIVENMSGYSFVKDTAVTWTPVYVGAVKNGNKVTFVIFGTYTYQTGDSSTQIGRLIIPSSVGAKLYPYTMGTETRILDQKNVTFIDNDSIVNAPLFAVGEIIKASNSQLNLDLRRLQAAGFTDGKTYIFRYEVTFLLSDNLAS